MTTPDIERPDVAAELAHLKDFQRATVDYVHDRFFGPYSTRRFLVADEVGLGKTLVARGVVARTIDELWDTVDRIDVIYICSNTQIAQQNLNRLRIGSAEATQHADRLTMLPQVVGDMKQRKVNFVSFTPGTSFDVLAGGGRAGERILIYRMLCDGFREGDFRANRWLRFFQGGSGRERFARQVRWFDQHERRRVPKSMTQAFAETVRTARDTESGQPLLQVMQDCAMHFNYLRAGRKVDGPTSSWRYRLIGQLRHLIARASVAELEPDLVILDEFQRFKDLMDSDEPGAELARELFDYGNARLLLLSATPYKMYTLPDEPEGDEHYADFIRTVRFLAGEPTATGLAGTLSTVRMSHIAGDLDRARSAQREAEAVLRNVMCRTERLAATPDRDGMIGGRELPGADLAPHDVREYVSATEITSAIDSHQDLLEFWRSSPYLFEFMDDYKVKRDLEQQLELGNPVLTKALADSPQRLSWATFAAYQAVDPGNAKLRGLVKDVIERGAWRLAWIPPSLPYVELTGPYAEPGLRDFTKRLIFSAWTVVPKTIGALVSYEAERRLRDATQSVERAYDAPRATALLTFQQSEGRLTGMPVLGILYPSVVLAEAGDPLLIARELSLPFPLPRDAYLEAVRGRVEQLLSNLPDGPDHGPEDDAWYWAPAFLLDHQSHPETQTESLPWDSGDDTTDQRSRLADHLARARSVTVDELGRRPSDLVDVLTVLAASGPGNVALRARTRGLGNHTLFRHPEVRAGAARMAWALRSFFNRPEIMGVVRGTAPDLPYWRAVLRHGVDGNLQAVFDEYLHVLFESEGLYGKPLEEHTEPLVKAVSAALSLRASNTNLHIFEANGQIVTLDRSHHLRSHFAVRFGRQRTADTQQDQREGAVRAAYNSPFWPFVLASTSVGQEGLDFHQYSHAVVHWNLPSNPVDLEQREGRVHRYKGHAVRKNVARVYGSDPSVAGADDPWGRLFQFAADDRPDGESEIFPYWIFPVPDGAKIERYTPVMPLSKESHALSRLLRTVGAYRMVIGQPRQEDLLRYLATAGTRDSDDLRINLTPGRPSPP